MFEADIVNKSEMKEKKRGNHVSKEWESFSETKFMKAMNEKLARTLTRIPRHGTKREIFIAKLNLFHYKLETAPLWTIIYFRKSIIHDRIVSVGYTEEEMKLLIS